jgi:hypothetical protein
MIGLLIFSIVHSGSEEIERLREKIIQKEDEIRALVLKQPGARELLEEYNNVMSKEVILKSAFTPEIKKLLQQMSQLLEENCKIYESIDYKRLAEEAEKYRSIEPKKFDELWEKKENMFADVNQRSKKTNDELIRLATQLKIDPWSSLFRAGEPEIQKKLTHINEQFKILITPLKSQLDKLLAELTVLQEAFEKQAISL